MKTLTLLFLLLHCSEILGALPQQTFKATISEGDKVTKDLPITVQVIDSSLVYSAAYGKLLKLGLRWIPQKKTFFVPMVGELTHQNNTWSLDKKTGSAIKSAKIRILNEDSCTRLEVKYLIKTGTRILTDEKWTAQFLCKSQSAFSEKLNTTALPSYSALMPSSDDRRQSVESTNNSTKVKFNRFWKRKKGDLETCIIERNNTFSHGMVAAEMGTLVIYGVTEDDGAVTNIETKSMAFKNSTLEDCVHQRLKSWKVPIKSKKEFIVSLDVDCDLIDKNSFTGDRYAVERNCKAKAKLIL